LVVHRTIGSTVVREMEIELGMKPQLTTVRKGYETATRTRPFGQVPSDVI
jgi:hypothetical protein